MAFPIPPSMAWSICKMFIRTVYIQQQAGFHGLALPQSPRRGCTGNTFNSEVCRCRLSGVEFAPCMSTKIASIVAIRILDYDSQTAEITGMFLVRHKIIKNNVFSEKTMRKVVDDAIFRFSLAWRVGVFCHLKGKSYLLPHREFFTDFSSHIYCGDGKFCKKYFVTWVTCLLEGVLFSGGPLKEVGF